MAGVVQHPAAQSAPRVGPGSYSASARRSLWRLTNKARCQTKQRATSRFDHYCNGGYSRATDLEPEKRTQNSSGNLFLVSSNSRLASTRESLSVETSFGDGDRFSTLASRTAAMKAAARNTAKPARIGFPSVSSRWTPTPEA